MTPIRVPFSLLAATALAVGAAGAQASTTTLNQWTWGNGNSVNATAPAYGGVAGGFTGTLAGSEISGLDGAIDTYCIELTEHFGFGNAYSNYTTLAASTYFAADASKVTALGKLISYVYGNSLFTSTAATYRDDLSTSLQLAIWNIIYDTDTTLSGGSFSDSSTYRLGTSNFAGANALLAGSQVASQAVSYDLYVLSSGNPYGTAAGNQDQLFWRLRTGGSTGGDPGTVPEPASLGLAALALGAAAAVRRRRSVTAAR